MSEEPVSDSVHLITADNVKGENAREFVYSLSMKGGALHELVANNLDLSTSHTALLVEKKPGVYAWIRNSQPLSHYHPKDGAKLFLLRTMVALTILNVAGQSKKMFIDITKSVNELVTIIADKLHIGNYTGYSLYSVNQDGTHKPLDLDLTMPEQTLSFDPIFFKRRFFCFTKSQLKDRVSAILAFNDAKSFVINSGYQLPVAVLPQLVRFSVYANANAPEEIAPNYVPSQFADLLPPSIKLPDDFHKLLTEIMKIPAPVTKEAAIEGYLLIAHTIPNFGCEKFRCKFSPNPEEKDKKKRINVTVFVGPQTISVTGEQPIEKIPWFRVSSVKEHKDKITIRYMEKTGADSELVLKAAHHGPELHSLIKGYMSITKSLGAEMMTDGFFAVSSADVSSVKINPQQFQVLYLPDTSGMYRFYPGSILDIETIVGQHFKEVEENFPQFFASFTSNLVNIKKDPCDQESTLRLILATNDLLHDEHLSDYFDPISLKRAAFLISTLNINLHTMDMLLKFIILMIKCLKLIRKETATQVDLAKKNQMENWLNTFKNHRVALQEYIKRLVNTPTDGMVIMKVQHFLINAFFDVQDMRTFYEPLSQTCSEPPLGPTVQQLTHHIELMLMPLISHDPPERLGHVFHMQQIQFYTNIVFAAAGVVLEDTRISGNAELVANTNQVLGELLQSMRNLQMTKMQLMMRPFSISNIDLAREQINTLQYALLSCKPQAAMIHDITENAIFENSIMYVRKQIDLAIKTYATIKVEPYREIPSSELVKRIHNKLVEICASFLGAKTIDLKDSESVMMAKKIEDHINTLKTLLTLLRASVASPSRAVFITISKAKVLLNDVLQHIRKLSSLFSDPTIVHVVSNLITDCDTGLKPCQPSFDWFHAHLGQLTSQIQVDNVSSKIIDKDIVLSRLRKVNAAQYPDKMLGDFNELRRGIYRTYQSLGETPEAQLFKPIVDDLDIMMIAINQLPPIEIAAAPPLVILPFYRSKDVYSMIGEFIPQMVDVSKFFETVMEFPLFQKDEIFIPHLSHWHMYFESMAGQLDSLQAHEMTLLARFREIKHKQRSLSMFTDVLQILFDSAKFADMLDVFYENCEVIIDKLSKPHISKADTERFSAKIIPHLQKLEVLLSKLPRSSNPEVAEKMDKLHRLITYGIDDVRSNDPARMQAFADNVYSCISELLPLLRDDATYQGLSNALLQLQQELSQYTELALTNHRNYSSARLILDVTGEEIHQMCEDFLNPTANEPSAEAQQKLKNVFDKFAAFPEALPGSLAFPVLSMKPHEFQDYMYDALRTIVHSQDSSATDANGESSISEELKRMIVAFATKAAKLVESVVATFGPERIAAKSDDIKGYGGDSEKALYFAKLLEGLSKTIQLDALLKAQTLPAVALKYNELRDVRVVTSLVRAQANFPADSEEAKLYELFVKTMEESDKSLATYFYSRLTSIANSCFELAKIDSAISEKIEPVNRLLEVLDDPTLLLAPNAQTLGKAATIFVEMEPLLVPELERLREDSVQAAQALNDFHALSEIRQLIEQWKAPLSSAMPQNDAELELLQDEIARKSGEEREAAVRLAVISHLKLAQIGLQKLPHLLAMKITKVPYAAFQPLSYITRVIEFAKNSTDSKIFGAVDPLQKLVQEISQASQQLFTEDALKADTVLQKSIPELIELVEQLLSDISQQDQTDYTSDPKLMRFYSADPVIAAMNAMEGTEFASITKELCQFIQKTLRSEGGEAAGRLMFTALGLLPSAVASSLSEAKTELISSLETVLRNFGTMHHVQMFLRTAQLDQNKDEIGIMDLSPESMEKFNLSVDRFNQQQLAMNNGDVDNDENTQAMLQELAGVVARLVKLLPAIDQRAVDLLGISPVAIMEHIIRLTQGAEGAKLDIYNASLKLYTFFEALDQESLAIQASHQIVLLIQALDNGNPEEINRTMRQLQALATAAIARGINVEFYEKVVEGITPIVQLTEVLKGLKKFGGGEEIESVTELISNDPAKLKALENAKRFLIDLITAESMKLPHEISEAKSLAALIDIRARRHLSARGMVGPHPEPKELLFLTSNMQLLGKRGLDLAGNLEPSFCLEFVKLFSRSLEALSEYSSSSDPQALRKLKRFIDNLGDMVDDLSLNCDEDQSTDQEHANSRDHANSNDHDNDHSKHYDENDQSFDGLKLRVLIALVNADTAIAQINASFSRSKIPQSFAQMLSDQKQSILETLERLKRHAGSVLEKNQDPERAGAFDEVFSRAVDAIGTLNDIQTTAEYEGLVEKEVEVSGLITKVAKATMKLTDVLELKYDPENAARLPRRFETPQIPVVENDLTVSAASEALASMVPDLAPLSAALALDNAKCVSAALALFQQVSEFLEQELRVSLTSLSLKNQVALTANVNALANETENLNRALRSKCLANPGWEAKVAVALKAMKESFESAIVLGQEAVTLAEAELATAAERKEKIERSIKPLQELLAVVDERAKGNDVLSNFLNLAATAARSVITTMTHAKEQPRDIQDLDILFQQVEEITKMLNEALETKQTETLADKINEILHRTAAELRGRNAEVTQIKMTMEAISKGLNDMKEAVKQKKMRPQKSPEELEASRNRLLKRLQLESRVLLFRWKVGYQEKKIAEVDLGDN